MMTTDDDGLATTNGDAGRISASSPEHGDIVDFLVEEAEVLDRGEFERWLEMLSDDISYRMPNRKTVYTRDGDGFDPRNSIFDDDHAMLAHRVNRLGEATAWERDPVPRLRRLVSNVTVRRTANADEYGVNSYFLVLRNRFDSSDYEMLSGERHDTLRRVPHGLKLCRRIILSDQVVHGSPWVTVFI